MKNILISSPDPHLWYILSISIYSITVKNTYLETYLILMNSLSPTLRVCLHWEIICMFLHCWLPGRTHEWPLWALWNLQLAANPLYLYCMRESRLSGKTRRILFASSHFQCYRFCHKRVKIHSLQPGFPFLHGHAEGFKCDLISSSHGLVPLVWEGCTKSKQLSSVRYCRGFSDME